MALMKVNEGDPTTICASKNCWYSALRYCDIPSIHCGYHYDIFTCVNFGPISASRVSSLMRWSSCSSCLPSYSRGGKGARAGVQWENTYLSKLATAAARWSCIHLMALGFSIALPLWYVFHVSHIVTVSDNPSFLIPFLSLRKQLKKSGWGFYPFNSEDKRKKEKKEEKERGGWRRERGRVKKKGKKNMRRKSWEPSCLLEIKYWMTTHCPPKNKVQVVGDRGRCLLHNEHSCISWKSVRDTWPWLPEAC